MELYGWVFSAFFLGSLIGIVGRRRRRSTAAASAVPFALGLGLFAIGLLIGGLAPSMPILVGARFIQGLGAGTIPPIAYVAIGRSLPERLRPRMFATLSTAWVLPGVIGPAIAGHRRRDARLALRLPRAAAAHRGRRCPDPSAACARSPRARAGATAARSAGTPRPPAAGARSSALGAGLLMAGLTSGRSIPLVVLVVAGLALGSAGAPPPDAARARCAPRPVLPAAVLLRGILTCAFFGVDAYVALTLVEWRGLSATAAGVALTAATLSWTAGVVDPGPRRRRAGRRTGSCGSASRWSSSGWRARLVLLPGRPAWLAARRRSAIAGLGMGLAYCAARADRPARGAARDAGHGLERPVADRFARHRARDRPDGRHRRCRPADDRRRRQPGWRPASRVAIAVGLGGLALSGRLRAADRAAAAVARDGARRRPPSSGRCRGACGRLRAAHRGRAPCRAARPRRSRTDVRRGASREDPRDPRLPQARDPVLRHHDPAQGRRRVQGIDRPHARAVRGRADRHRGRDGVARLHLQRADGLPARRRASSRSASWASCRPRRSPSSTPSSTAPTRSRSIATRSQPGQKVLIVDDLLATGGTVKGTIELIERLKGEVVGLAFLVELEFLKGRDRLEGRRVTSVIQY